MPLLGSPIIHIGSPSQEEASRNERRRATFVSSVQAHEQVKTKIPQSFTQTPPPSSLTHVCFALH